MKEQIINFIGTVIIIIIIAIILGNIVNLISRVQVYSDKEQRERLDICLDKGDTFQECYHGIFDKYANFQGKK